MALIYTKPHLPPPPPPPITTTTTTTTTTTSSSSSSSSSFPPNPSSPSPSTMEIYEAENTQCNLPCRVNTLPDGDTKGPIYIPSFMPPFPDTCSLFCCVMDSDMFLLNI